MIRIILEGEFGWEIESSKILPLLDEAGGEDLDVHIDSRGGSVFKGIRVYNDFRDYKRKFPESQNILTVKGVAFSMSSYFMMNSAFSLVAVEDNVPFMMHNVSGGVYGDYRDGEKWLEIIKGLGSLLVLAYTQKTGKSKKEIQTMMDDETWFFGENIVKAGFADEVIKTDGPKNETEAIVSAKLQFEEINKKIKSEIIEDSEFIEIAALFTESKNKNTEPKPATQARDNNNQEVSTMTLKEFLETNSAAKDEYITDLQSQFDAGKDEAEKEIRDRTAKAAPFIGNAEYPKQISEMAISVIKGEKPTEILDTVVATADMVKELQNSNNAGDEQRDDTPPNNGGETQLSSEYQKDGIIMNSADMLAEEKRMKTMLGQEVN